MSSYVEHLIGAVLRDEKHPAMALKTWRWLARLKACR
jgi:hypothetical protein